VAARGQLHILVTSAPRIHWTEGWVVPRHGLDTVVRQEFLPLSVFETKFLYEIKSNWCHYFNFIYILPDLYMFRAHRLIFSRVHTAVHTTIGSVSVLIWPCALYVVVSLGDYSLLSSHQDRPQHTEHTARAVQTLNQWLCEQLCELSW